MTQANEDAILLRPDQVANLYGIQRSTVYDWKMRPKKYSVPQGLFIKFGARLLLRRDLLEQWILERNQPA